MPSCSVIQRTAYEQILVATDLCNFSRISRAGRAERRFQNTRSEPGLAKIAKADQLRVPFHLLSSILHASARPRHSIAYLLPLTALKSITGRLSLAGLMIHSIGWEMGPSRSYKDHSTMMKIPTGPEWRDMAAGKNTVGNR